MPHAIRSVRRELLAAGLLAGALALAPLAGSCATFTGTITASMTVDDLTADISVSAPANVGVTRSTGNVVASAVTIRSHSRAPFRMMVDQGLNAMGSQRNFRGSAGTAAYDLCGDPACTSVWTPNGAPATGILVTPGSAANALPLTVVRPASAVDDGSYSDTVTLTMYF